MMKQLLKSKPRLFWMKTIIFGVLFLIIGVYGYINTKSIIRGVRIDAEIQQQNDKATLARVKGVAENANFITLNGREIFIDKQGNFSEDIAFPTGFSVVTLVAQDTLGKNTKKTFEVYTKNNQSVAISNSIDNNY